MNEDFTEEMLRNQNEEVEDLCGCRGKEKTWSNRVLKENHEEWCFYFQHVDDKQRALLDRWKADCGERPTRD